MASYISFMVYVGGTNMADDVEGGGSGCFSALSEA